MKVPPVPSLAVFGMACMSRTLPVRAPAALHAFALPGTVVLMNLLVVILNYRTPDLTIDCLRSLRDEVAPAQARVVVVDGGSADGSARQIGEAIQAAGWGDWASLLPLEHNGGYAAGNNAGVRLANGEGTPAAYVLLLNPDTVVRPGALRDLVAFMDDHPKAGIAGSRLVNAAGQAECSAHRFPSPLGELEGAARFGPISRALGAYRVSPPIPERPQLCDWVSGASLIIRREVFDSIGLLDEGFFLYFEEVDFCRRAKQAGWEIWYVPSSEVVHLEGASTGIRKGSERRARYWFESRRRFFVKHYGVVGLMAADLLWVVGRLLWNLRRWTRMASPSGRDPRWFAFDLLFGDAKAVLSGDVFSIPSARGRTCQQ